jgi:hypothetical protein
VTVPVNTPSISVVSSIVSMPGLTSSMVLSASMTSSLYQNSLNWTLSYYGAGEALLVVSPLGAVSSAFAVSFNILAQ